MVHFQISPVFLRVIRTEEYFFPFPSVVPGAVLQTSSALPLPSKSYTIKLGVVGTGTDIFS